MVLAPKRPITVIENRITSTDVVTQERTDDTLIKRIEELETKQKLLEQQIASQQKQFQQLVDFIKKKLK
jgi:chaperonin cofactor prefoldin